MASLPLLHHLIPSLPLPTSHTTFNNTSTTTLFFFSKNKPSLTLKCSSTSKLDQEQEQETIEFEAPLSQVWREIQGMNDWKGLIEPTMNPHLRREIIRYGELAQACYDSFDFDPHSKYCGTCKYHPSHFFHKLNLSHSGYSITRYLYATSNINLPNFFQNSNLASVWSPHANWMGYVAVITDKEHVKRLGRRDILIAWRGTVTYLEWIHDLKDILRPAFFSNDQTIKVKRLLNYYKDEEVSITITGHSLGAALAALSAYDIAEVRLNVVDNSERVPVTVFSFAGPRVGNLKFKERCEELGVKVLRVVNVHDVVPTVPGIITNEKFLFQKYIEDALSFPWSYAHVGTEIALDHKESPFVKGNKDLVSAHNLEVHLHLVDGYHGKGKRFSLASKRDIALVNKSCDFLRSEYGVPPHWRQDENKGMVRDGDGRWILPERPRLEAHPPDMAHHLQQVIDNHLPCQPQQEEIM
ncbi:unnamed protein product [Sphenostylis stenocarpa]|uniref:Fungal lipase-type domain-containing protein n=1 Tax=Sphenostylis stenocarpa TaxID=92480 RepID=A0AA86VFL4_9FABA|nr:unnamed protein product [Sphenostylis stenocarpa]